MYLYIQARNLKWHYPITVFKKLRSCLHTAESAPNLKFWPICDISVGYRDTILMYSGYCSLHPNHHTSYQDISCGFCFPSFILRTRLCRAHGQESRKLSLILPWVTLAPQSLKEHLLISSFTWIHGMASRPDAVAPNRPLKIQDQISISLAEASCFESFWPTLLFRQYSICLVINRLLCRGAQT